MTGRWTLRLPIYGDPKTALLSANERAHWTRRHTVTAKWREAAGWAARSAQVPRLDRAQVIVLIGWADNRKRDVNNWQPTAKALVDGLVDAGVLEDDNDAHLVGPDLRRDWAAEHPEITIEIVALWDALQDGAGVIAQWVKDGTP